MATGFNINSLLSGETLKQTTTFTKKIHYSKLTPDPENEYSMDHIEELADRIETFGLLQNLVAKPLPDSDKYIIIAGHRRREAIRILVEERGLTEFEMVDTNLSPEDEDKTISRIKHHVTNVSTRDLTSYEKMTAVAELKVLFEKAKSDGHPIKGKIRDLIAEEVNLGTTQVQKMLTVDARSDDETKEALREGSLSLEQAYKNVTSPKTVNDGLPPTPTIKQNLFDPYKELKKLESSCNKVLGLFIDENLESQELSDILNQIISLKEKH